MKIWVAGPKDEAPWLAFDSEETAASWLISEGYGNWRGRGGEDEEGETWWPVDAGTPLQLREVPLWDSARVVSAGQNPMR